MLHVCGRVAEEHADSKAKAGNDDACELLVDQGLLFLFTRDLSEKVLVVVSVSLRDDEEFVWDICGTFLLSLTLLHDCCIDLIFLVVDHLRMLGHIDILGVVHVAKVGHVVSATTEFRLEHA